MSDDNVFRQDLRHSLGAVRKLIHSYSGLYPDEDLARDVLSLCDEIAKPSQATMRLNEARRIVHERCTRLAHAADRFSSRDPVKIAAFRAQAAASIDMLQDVLLDARRRQQGPPRIGALLRRKSL